MLLLKIGPEVLSRAQGALPALPRSEKEDGHRPSKFLIIITLEKTRNTRNAGDARD